MGDSHTESLIIAHRQKYYHIGSVDYSKDQKEYITIWREAPLTKGYEKDYKAMTGSFIYDTTPLTIDELKKRIKELEAKFRNNE